MARPRRAISVLIAVLTGLAACGGGGGGQIDGPVSTSVRSAMDRGTDRGIDAIWIYIDDGTGPPVLETAGVETRATRLLCV